MATATAVEELVNKVRRVNPTLCGRMFLLRSVRVSRDGMKGLWSPTSFFVTPLHPQAG